VNIHHPPDYSSVPQDNAILEHYGINELNFESIKKYREKFSALKPSHPWNGLEMKEFLYKIGAWGKVRNTNKEGLTLAGLLMFSEERIITEVLPQYFLEYRESLEETLFEDWSKRFTSQDGTWSGNVFDFYFKTSTDLSDDFHALYLNDRLNQADETAALSCLHESLINALVHADYYGEGGIVIEKETDLLRFSNPGLLRVPVEQALEGNISNLRNPNLFKMFILIGLCKRTGSGLKGIKTTWESYGDDAFDLIQDPTSERTILTLYAKQSVLDKEHPEEVIENDLSLFPEEDESFLANFDDIESSYNKETNSMNNKEHSYNNGLNSYNKDDNSVNKEFNSYNNADNSYNREGNSLNNESDSGNNEVENMNSYNNVQQADIDEKADIIVNDLESEDHEGEVIQPSSQLSPKEIEEKLWEMSELARRKKRLAPAVMEEIIVSLCAQKTLMLRELAYLLDRTPDGLRNNYLAKLLDKGKVRLKYPNQVNHPKQAYIIVKQKEK
jgi:ATP-dependent DNA helicase RecG